MFEVIVLKEIEKRLKFNANIKLVYNFKRTEMKVSYSFKRYLGY